MKFVIRKTHKILIYGFLIIATVAFTFLYVVNNGMHQMMTSPLGRQAIGIAISELKYGFRGYRGYYKIYRTLKREVMTSDPDILKKHAKAADRALSDPMFLNSAIEKTFKVDKKILTEDGGSFLYREDKGLVTYFKLAFLIFGHKVEGFLYLYFLLFLISIIIFFVSFYRQPALLNILLLFVCSHFMIISATQAIVMSVYNPRFLPVLGVIPVLYLVLLIMRKQRLKPMTFIGACLQTAILMLVIHARMCTVYQILFLTTVFILAILWHWRHNPRLGRYVFNKVYIWPMALVFLGGLILHIHLTYQMHPSYMKATRSHLFWHPLYIGLASHPDSLEKYGIAYDDAVGFDVARKRGFEQYGYDISGNYELTEMLVKREFLGILRKDPRFFVESYLYKFLLFFKNYFVSYFGAISNLLKAGIAMVLILGTLLAGKGFLKRWYLYFCLLLLFLAFSLLPSILVIPAPSLIADPAFLFTAIIYMLFIWPICFIMKRCVGVEKM